MARVKPTTPVFDLKKGRTMSKHKKISNAIMDTMCAEARHRLHVVSWWQFHERSYWQGVLFAVMAYRQGIVSAIESGHLLQEEKKKER